MDQFLPSHQKFAQNSTRNSKIMILKILVKKWQKDCSVQGLKINFWIQCFYRIFWHVSRIQKIWNFKAIKYGYRVYFSIIRDQSYDKSTLALGGTRCLRSEFGWMTRDLIRDHCTQWSCGRHIPHLSFFFCFMILTE